MPELFKLVKKEFSKVDKEWQWTYLWLGKFSFNGKVITQITITDHYQEKHKDIITNELILNILWTRLNHQEMKPFKKIGIRDIYIWDWASYQGKNYHLTFWFKDRTTNHLWIRNCYPID